MLESPLQNKVTISLDKSDSCLENIPVMTLSKILEVELTSKDQVLKPFWNSSSKKISKKLWLPQVIGSHDLEQKISLNGCLSTLERNLPYLTQKIVNPVQKNLLKNCLKLSQFSPQDIMANENILTRKYRFYPTDVQKCYLGKCFGGHRFFYNRTITYIENHGLRSNILIRPHVMISDKHNSKHPALIWSRELLYDQLDLAIAQACSNVKSCITKLKQKQIKHFHIKFLSKRNQNQICYFPKTAFRNCKLTPNKLGKNNTKIIFKDNIELSAEGSFSISKDAMNHYYFNLPFKTESKYDSATDNRLPIVSLDPGVRSFQTYFSEEEFGKIGNDFCDRYKQIDARLDKLQSISNCKAASHRTRSNIRKKCFVLRNKIQNITRDLHWKTASFLTKKYKVILLPEFGTQQMLKKSTLAPKIKRNMMHLSHYTFKERLLHKGKQNHSVVIICSEAYTTQTCTRCGLLNDAEKNKTYTCNSCYLSIDRDMNGARNIYIKSLSQL